MQKVVDLLGPPPATVVAWEQQQLAQLQVAASAATTDAEQTQPNRSGPHYPQSSIRPSQIGSGNTVSGGSSGSTSQTVRSSDYRPDSMHGRSRSGAVDATAGDGDGSGSRDPAEDQQGMSKTRRK